MPFGSSRFQTSAIKLSTGRTASSGAAGPGVTGGTVGTDPKVVDSLTIVGNGPSANKKWRFVLSPDETKRNYLTLQYESATGDWITCETYLAR